MKKTKEEEERKGALARCRQVLPAGPHLAVRRDRPCKEATFHFPREGQTGGRVGEDAWQAECGNRRAI